MRVPGRCAFATYAVAVVKMSHSIRASASSRLRRDTFASRSVTGRRVSPRPVHCPCRARNTQFARVLSDMLSRLAASGMVSACSRNSFVYFCRGNRSIPHLQTSDHRLKASTFSSLAHRVIGQVLSLITIGSVCIPLCGISNGTRQTREHLPTGLLPSGSGFLWKSHE